VGGREGGGIKNVLKGVGTQEEDASTSLVKASSEFKTGSKWKPFKEGVIAYFNSIKGTHNIPLAAIHRSQCSVSIQTPSRDIYNPLRGNRMKKTMQKFLIS
jgi:hypothetical protein